MKTLTDNVLIFASKAAPIASQIKEYFEDQKVTFEYTSTIQKALDFLSGVRPCLVIIDNPTDDPKTLELCKKFKKTKEDLRFNVLFFVDKTDFEEQLTWFKNGVDEFATRDTNIILLCQRIQCILSKYESAMTDNIPDKGFIIDRERYIVFKNGKEIFLPRKEFELLTLLSSKPTKVFTREDIFRLVWGNKSVVGDRTIDVHIRKIREKIGEEYVVTVKGVGYKFIEQ